MNNKKEITSLGEKAFNALIKNNFLNAKSVAECHVLNSYKLQKYIPLFLQAIAEGDEVTVRDFLKESPQLAIIARGAVKTFSGFILEDITAIQLAYTLEDYEICDVLFSYFDKTNIKQVHEQLLEKTKEINNQKQEFEEYDLSFLVKTISSDDDLGQTGYANETTLESLNEFVRYFTPCTIKFGRTFNIQNLIRAYIVLEENFPNWNRYQHEWFYANIISHLLKLVPSRYAQEFSKGLVNMDRPRSFKILNYETNEEDFTYYSFNNDGTTPILGKDFLIDILLGAAANRPAYGVLMLGTESISSALEAKHLFTQECLTSFVEKVQKLFEQSLQSESINNTHKF